MNWGTQKWMVELISWKIPSKYHMEVSENGSFPAHIYPLKKNRIFHDTNQQPKGSSAEERRSTPSGCPARYRRRDSQAHPPVERRENRAR